MIYALISVGVIAAGSLLLTLSMCRAAGSADRITEELLARKEGEPS